LWPERFPDRAVKLLEQTLGPFAAAGQLEQSPKPKGGGVVKYDWWNAWEPEHYPPMDFILASLDTAYTEKTENDFSAITIWGVFTYDTLAVPGRIIGADGRPMYLGPRNFYEESPRVMLIHAWQARLGLHDLVTKVAESCRSMKADLLLIENKASGISVAQEMQRLYSHENWGVELNDPKSIDKLARLHSVVPLFAPELRQKKDAQGRILYDRRGQPITERARDGVVYAPSAPNMPTFRVWAEEVIRQVESFPHGAHDDMVDTVSQALRCLRDRGLLSLPAERLADLNQAKQYWREPPPLYPTV
jgi:phage terminase large subunit-like protein